MKIISKFRFFSGILILAILFITYFIKVEDKGSNYIVNEPLLGVLIFNNPLILLIYIVVSIIFIITGIKRIKIE